MTIGELCENVYEDLNGVVRSVEMSDDGSALLAYECDHWVEDARVGFRLRCVSPLAVELRPHASESICWHTDHALLEDYRSAHGCLYSRRSSCDVDAMVGRMYLAHENFYDGAKDLRDYANLPGVLSSSNSTALLARGPARLLAAYQSALGPDVDSYIVESKRNLHVSESASILLFDLGFVVCEEVIVEPAA